MGALYGSCLCCSLPGDGAGPADGAAGAAAAPLPGPEAVQPAARASGRGSERAEQRRVRLGGAVSRGGAVSVLNSAVCRDTTPVLVV